MRKRITADVVAKTKPRATRLEIFDTDTPGFSLRITPEGARSFSVSYRLRGQTKKVRRTLGQWPATSLTAARAEADRYLKAAAAGVDADALARAQAIEAKAADRRQELRQFENAAEAFLTEYAGRKHADPDDTRGYFDRHLLPAWRGLPLSLITPALVEHVVRQLAEGTTAKKGAPAPTAAVRLHGHIRKFFRWCVGMHLVDQSPCASLPPPAKLESRDRVLTAEELAAVWRAAGRLGYPFGQFWQFMYLTGGQRLSDVAGARWDEISGDVWTVRDPTKSDGTPHVVPLSKAAQELLAGIPRQAGPFVFSTTKGRKPVVPGSKAKQELDTAAGVTGWRYHDTRRTVSTILADEGEPPHVAEVLQNRRSIVSGVVATYNRSAYLADKQRAVEVLAKHLQAVLAKHPEQADDASEAA